MVFSRKHDFPVNTDEHSSTALAQSKPLSTALTVSTTAPAYNTPTVPIRSHESDQQSAPRLGRIVRVIGSVGDENPLTRCASSPASAPMDSTLGIARDFHRSTSLTVSHNIASPSCCFGCQLSEAQKPTCDEHSLCTILRLNVIQFSSRLCWSFPLSCGCPIKHLHRRRIPNENLLVLSIIQLLCGFASIILSSVALTRAAFLYRMATGMWTGFLMLVAGTQGLITTRRPIVCTLIGLLILCIVVTIAASLLIGVSVAGTIEDGFLNRESSPSKSLQIIKFSYAFQQGGISSSGNSPTVFNTPHPSNSPNWTDINPLRVRKLNDDLTSTKSSAHLHARQLIIHVLLLLIGILESSVSLATSVLCCRYIHSRSRSDFHSYSGRTNIVSLDTATASQAAAVLQSEEINRFFGSENVLLALDPHSLANQQAHLNLSKGLDRPPAKPYLHYTVAPFLPDSSRSTLILTQARTGSMAWTAARAAASILGGELAEHGPSLLACPPGLPSPIRPSHSLSQRIRAKFSCSKQPRRPRFLITSLDTRTPRFRRVTGGQNPALGHIDSFTYPAGSTLLYVIPPPSRDDPPMIFPPFPPTYSSLQRRPTHALPNRLQRRYVDPRDTEAPGLRNTTGAIPRPSFRPAFISRILRRRNSPRRLFTFAQRGCNVGTRTSAPLANSSLICAIDRLLQPVLIVEDPKAFTQTKNGLHPDPPEYTALDQGSRMFATPTD